MDDTLYKSFHSLLTTFLAFRSISTDPIYHTELTQTASWLNDLFTSEGFKSKLITGYDNPIVLASLEVDPTLQTMLIYGHYDVQPAAKEEGWKKEPFELETTDERLIGRGVVDNKGQILIHIATIFHLIKNDSLRYNVTFFIEGNEETGSATLAQCVKDYAAELKADYVLISDGEILEALPMIEVGLRGGVNATIELRTLSNDLHSGIYGGAAPNAAHEAARLIAGLVDTDGHVLIDGFYEGVQEPSEDELKNNAAIPFSEENHTKITGSKYPFNGTKYDIYTQTGLVPSLEITGVQSGYVGVGFRNSIAATSTVKINIRLVEGQSPEKIEEVLKAHLKRDIPEYVDWKIDFDIAFPAVKIDTSDHIFKTVRGILADVWGCESVNKYSGGSIPIVIDFQEVLGVPIIMLPLGNEDCNMHGLDENFRVEYVKKGLQVSKRVFGK